VQTEPADAIALDREAKNELNVQFAQVGRALANPHRVELLDLLAQGERSVEVLAARASISVGLASAHLQVLRRAGLVASRRDGTRIVYRLVGDDVYVLLASVRALATARLAAADRAARVYMGDPVEIVSREELLARVRAGIAVVVDLRPTEEYEAGHILGAISIPLAELEAHLAGLSPDAGSSPTARPIARSPPGVELLRRSGDAPRGSRTASGRLAGLPVATGRARDDCRLARSISSVRRDARS
jgi:DNA-binding transcriptional ArsR family regulator